MLFKNFLLLPIFLYLIVVLFFPVMGNYAVNDDWIFYRQIQHTIDTGDFTISSLIDPSFIVQFLLGYSWGSVVGLSFGNLRILSVLIALGFFFTTIKILKLPKLSPITILLATTTLVFNPLIFYSSLNFMTEIYFLFLVSVSVYFFLKDLSDPVTKPNLDFFLALFWGGLAFLERQYGIALFVSYICIHLLILKVFKKKNKFSYQKIAWTLLFLIVAFFIYLVWPRHQDLAGQVNLIYTLGDMGNFWTNVQKFPMSLPYFFFFLSPLLLLILKPRLKNKFSLFIFLLFFIPNTYYLFIYNVFPLGNIFYLEGFSLKSDYRPVISFGNLAIFKLLFSILISYLISTFLQHLIYWIKDLKFKNRPNLLAFLSNSSYSEIFLVLCSFFSFSLIFVGKDFYDRYLLPPIFFLILFLALRFNSIFANIRTYKPVFQKLFFTYIGFFTFFSLALNYDFFKTQDLLWGIAERIQVEQEVYDSLYVDDIHAKFKASLLETTFTGNEKLFFSSRDAKCFVQKYSINEETNLILQTDRIFQRLIENPRIHDSKKKSISRVTKNLSNLLYNEPYFSPLAWLVGGEVFVGGYCRGED